MIKHQEIASRKLLPRNSFNQYHQPVDTLLVFRFFFCCYSLWVNLRVTFMHHRTPTYCPTAISMTWSLTSQANCTVCGHAGYHLFPRVLSDGCCSFWAFQVALIVKNLPAKAGDLRDASLIPRFWRYPGRGHGKPLQYSCLENPMDRGAWWATVHGVAKSGTWLR